MATGAERRAEPPGGSRGEQPASHPRLRAVKTRIDGLSRWMLFALVVIPLFVVFLATVSMSRTRFDVDPFTNVVTAWRLGTSGSVFLPDHVPLTHPDYVGNVSWIVPEDGTAVGKYPPGAAFHAAPLYAVWPQDARVQRLEANHNPDAVPVYVPMPPYGPAAIVSALVVALAMGFLALSFRRLAAGSTSAAGAYVAGLGTTAWSVAADGLWQHGPGMMWIALAGVLSVAHLVGSGAAYGVAILVRPLNAFIAAATGLYISFQQRSLLPVLKIGAGAFAGLALLVAYNAAVYGEPSLLGGYDSEFIESTGSLDLVAYLRNVGLSLVSPTRGVLIWSPFLLVLIPGIGAAWRAAPSWVRGGALGGLVYLLVQLKANRYTGGAGFPAYRYPLEALTAAAPLLFLAYTKWVVVRPRALWLFRRLIILSFAFHTVFAIRF